MSMVKFEEKGRHTMNQPYDKKRFVKHYIDAYKKDMDINQLAQKVGVSVSVLRPRINNLKASGVNLPKLKILTRKKIADELNEFIEKNL